jgi:hypothetical protein
LVRAIGDGTITDADAKLEMNRLKEEIEKQQTLLQRIIDQLDTMPSAELIQTHSAEVVDRFQRALFPTHRHQRGIGPIMVPLKVGKKGESVLDASLYFDIRAADSCIGNMSWDDKRTLLQLTCGCTTPDGKRGGDLHRVRFGS